ncbi:MAG: hypothetical protein KatS3mg001_165 [Candidatus Pacearchaeota archaeon]|nr:MAG: hypothetical protein KatS3mg001_165 [Candidatus Pacearchaeota archaeon]
MECGVCGINLEEKNYYEAISSKGVILICQTCKEKENFPILKKPTEEQIKKTREILPFYKKAESLMKEKLTSENSKEDLELMKIIDKNYEKSIVKEKKKFPDLVENFNWKILNERRKKKLTREKIALDLGIPVSAIKFAEHGYLPENYKPLLKKLENYLGISLFKVQPQDEEPIILQKQESLEDFSLNLDRESIKKLKISDIKKIQEQIIYNEIVDFEEQL